MRSRAASAHPPSLENRSDPMNSSRIAEIADDRPARRASRHAVVAWGSWSLAVLLLVVTYVDLLLPTSRPGGPLALDPYSAILVGIVVLAWSTAGGILATRLPGNPIGWLLCAVGFLFAVTTGAAALADLGAVVQPGSIPGAVWLAWLAQWSIIPAVVLSAIVLPLVYPTGMLVSRRWRGVVWLGVAAGVLGIVGSMFGPWPRGTLPGMTNPLEVDGPGQTLVEQIQFISTAVAGLAILLGVTSLVVRFRRSRGIERLQLKWFAYVFAVSGSLLGVAFLGSVPSGPNSATQIAILAGFASLPATIGVAVLRYRLFDIDLVIRRTLVYVPLTAALAGIYAASIVLFQRLFIAFTGNKSDGAVILSTLILATTFTPIKNAFQARVDRSFRETADLDRRLRAFTETVATGWARPDFARTLRAFLRVAVDATGASGGQAFVQESRGEKSVGETSARNVGPTLEVLVGLGPRRFGRVELDPRRGGRRYSESEVAALRAAGDRLAVALEGRGGVQ
jgi:hypothetical protein